MDSSPFYMNTLKGRPLDPGLPYQRPEEWLRAAEKQLDEMGKLIRQSNPPNLFAPDAPLPDPVLRATPQI